LIGLPYPAGPEIDRLAENGNPKAYDFPRPLINDANDDFSFSGLKTSIRYFLRDHPELRSVGRLTLWQSFRCVRLVLWDETQRRLVSFREVRASG